jgi:MYXO-CTERM domain-containing protein
MLTVMRRLVVGLPLAACALAAVPGQVLANGRPPQTMGVHFRPGHPDEILLAATFGALFSTDGGDTWRWFCETAVGYGGTFDPDYAVSEGGTVFATTFDGVQIMSDGCTFATSPTFGESFAGVVAEGPDGRVFLAMNYPGNELNVPPIPPDYKLYRSDNDGASWDAGTTVGTGGETWQSLEIAPSDPDRIYLTGYRLDKDAEKVRLLFRSDNGGTSYAPLSVGAFELTGRSDLKIAAISPLDPDRVLARVTWWNPSGVVGDAFYLTTNGGGAWTKVLELNDNAPGVTFLSSGDAVIGTFRSGVHHSTNQGASFSLLTTPQPNVYCLREAPDHSLWACTNNLDVPPFNNGLMRTTDLENWTPIMSFEEDIVGPVDCPAGTIQQDCCTVKVEACPFNITPEWCYLRAQLGILANPFECPTAFPDASMVGGESPVKPGSCCDIGGGQPAGAALLALVVGASLRRRRRRRG